MAGKLELYDTGHYGEVAGRALPRGTELQFIPSLAAILTRAEYVKQSRLVRAEVLRIRDSAMVLVVPREAARDVDQQRGYTDVDPARAWQSWLQLRPEIERAPRRKPRQKKPSMAGCRGNKRGA